jgi:hypothetical protein
VNWDAIHGMQEVSGSIPLTSTKKSMSCNASGASWKIPRFPWQRSFRRIMPLGYVEATSRPQAQAFD